MQADNTFRPGDRVRLISTTDTFTHLLPGSRGTVIRTDATGTVHVAWDEGSRLGIVPDEDVIAKVGGSR